MGSWAAEIFEEHGGKVIAVSDAFGAVYNENGLDIKALRRHIADGDLLSAFSEGASCHPNTCAQPNRGTPVHWERELLFFSQSFHLIRQKQDTFFA